MACDSPKEPAANHDPEMENQDKSGLDFLLVLGHEVGINHKSYAETYKFVSLLKLPIEDGRDPVRPLF